MNFKFARCTLITAGLALMSLFAWPSALQAFPTYMGVYGNIQRQGNGDPGVYTILMNQDYYGLHASIGMQINGGTWSEYRMTYSGTRDGNSVWTFSPSVVYPVGSVIHYYFHGYEDGSSSVIYDNNNGANYSYTAQGPSTTDITSNFDVHGNIFNLGTESTDFSQFGLQLSYVEQNNGSAVNFASNHWYNDWNWRHGGYYGLQSGYLTMMKLDSLNRLVLYKPDTTSDQPVIVLDPGAGTITINGQPVGSGGTGGNSGGNSSLNTLVVGSGNTANGQNAAAFGKGTTAQGFSQVVLGEYSATGTENSMQRVDTDPVFVIGNGVSAYQSSNAFTVNWNGDTKISGNLKVDKAILVQPHGDLLMGEFTVQQASSPQ